MKKHLPLLLACLLTGLFICAQTAQQANSAKPAAQPTANTAANAAPAGNNSNTGAQPAPAANSGNAVQKTTVRHTNMLHAIPANTAPANNPK